MTYNYPIEQCSVFSITLPTAEEAMEGSSKPMCEAAARLLNSVLTANVPEGAILRDEDEIL